jgi:hypothetical protein
MTNHLLRFLLCFFVSFSLFASTKNKKIEYNLTDDLIDVVIVTHPKDKSTIDLCIDGIRNNCSSIRRVIVVSSEPLTDKAEWFDEANYPFSKVEVGLKIGRGNSLIAKSFFGRNRSLGWYYQQLLKLYAPYVIPDISANVLMIDADTIFLNPVEFLDEKNCGLYSVSPLKQMEIYFGHAKRLVPHFKRVFPELYCICHHMLFQKAILDDLFKKVENTHKMPFWEAFCSCVDIQRGGASEYIIYFCFAFSRSNQPQLRQLKWKNSPDLDKIETFREEGYHFVSFHSYLTQNKFKFR